MYGHQAPVNRAALMLVHIVVKDVLGQDDLVANQIL